MRCWAGEVAASHSEWITSLRAANLKEAAPGSGPARVASLGPGESSKSWGAHVEFFATFRFGPGTVMSIGFAKKRRDKIIYCFNHCSAEE